MMSVNRIYLKDEIHFLCQCPLYIPLRTKLFQTLHDSNTEFFDLDVFDQFVYVIRANQQRHVIKAIPLKQSSYLTVQVNS